MTVSICGHPASEARGAPGPFAKLIAFGYDDGPTSGVVRCESGSASYRFDLLAVDVGGVHDPQLWDRGEELRIFGLTLLPPRSFERIVEILEPAALPQWPIWAPGAPNPSPALLEIIERDVAPIVEAVDRTDLVVAASSLLAAILAVDAFPPEGRTSAPDWFSFLGFAAPEPVAARG